MTTKAVILAAFFIKNFTSILATADGTCLPSSRISSLDPTQICAGAIDYPFFVPTGSSLGKILASYF